MARKEQEHKQKETKTSGSNSLRTMADTIDSSNLKVRCKICRSTEDVKAVQIIPRTTAFANLCKKCRRTK